MSHRHLDELDRAVAVARRAVTVGHLDRPDRLTQFLYRRWYLGQPATSRVARLPVWQSWGPLWDEAVARRRSSLVRLHLSCAPHTSLHAIGLVTQRARGWDHPWRLTSTALGCAVPTPDATVLYLPVEGMADLRGPVTELLHEIRPFLARAVPALTLRIGRGASLAQNPSDGRSFGEHRCSLVATSVLETMRYHHREQVHRAMAAFADAGVDPRRPYLETEGSWDRGWAA
jgi:hypothetical protein